jgi:hypothetical protein
MTNFFKKLFCSCGHDDLSERQKKARQQDAKVREGLSEQQIDKGLKDTMAGSDPVAKY